MYRNLALITLFLFMISNKALAATYQEMHTLAIKHCESINPEEYETGLIFNPKGYQSLYRRSACFQDAAIKFRDTELCSAVRQRSSLFFSSWGYSKSRCEELVKERIRSDEVLINKEKENYEKNAVQLLDFTIMPNGNGRDFDIIPIFKEGYSHNYHLEFTLIDSSNIKNRIILDSTRFYLSDSNIRIYLPQSKIKEVFPAFELNKPYAILGTLTFIAVNIEMSDSFIQKIWPKKDRTQSLEKVVHFRLGT